MRKLHKILTLTLALMLILGIMAVPASAVRYDDMYVVWTEDEFWDLNNPRPVPPEETFICMFVVTKGNMFDWAKYNENWKAYGDGMFNIWPTCDFSDEITIKAPDVQAAAKETYDRITDTEYKAIIAEYFGLDVGSGATKPTANVKNVTEESVYQALIALKETYPEGMRWTDENYHKWRGSTENVIGFGCAGFAFLLNDAAFSYLLPGRQIDKVSLSDVRVGDILRLKNDSHSVIVLEVKADSVVIAEGNYNSSVHWGRTLSKAEVEASDYMLTRWPEDSAQEPQPAPGAVPSAWAQPEVTEATQAGLVPADLLSSYTSAITREEFCRLMVALVEASTGTAIADYVDEMSAPFTDTSSQEVKAAYGLGIVNGTSATTFNPSGSITRQEAAAMLARTGKMLGLVSGNGVSFSDSGKIASWAKDSVAFVSGLTDPVSGSKIMGGVGGNNFGPLGTYTREQAIATALRLFHCAP